MSNKPYLRTIRVNEKTLRALVEAGAIKKVRIVGDGAFFHVEAMTQNGPVVALTHKGAIKTWSSLDTAAKWIRGLGLGSAQLDVAKWQPGQRGLNL
jgi:hypothetical protein